MVRIIADEFLTEERDRKYYADHYTCCPPPLFILLITLIEVSKSTVAIATGKHRRVVRLQAVEARRFVRRRGPDIFLDNRFTDGGDVSLTRRPPFTSQEDSWYSILFRG
jgi:hypothetical protein